MTSAVTGALRRLECDAVLLVTARLPRDGLARGLAEVADRWEDAGLRSVRAIGDAWAPSSIASAVWWGRRYAEEIDAPPGEVPFRRELVAPSD